MNRGGLNRQMGRVIQASGRAFAMMLSRCIHSSCSYTTGSKEMTSSCDYLSLILLLHPWEYETPKVSVVLIHIAPRFSIIIVDNKYLLNIGLMFSFQFICKTSRLKGSHFKGSDVFFCCLRVVL